MDVRRRVGWHGQQPGLMADVRYAPDYAWRLEPEQLKEHSSDYCPGCDRCVSRCECPEPAAARKLLGELQGATWEGGTARLLSLMVDSYEVGVTDGKAQQVPGEGPVDRERCIQAIRDMNAVVVCDWDEQSLIWDAALPVVERLAAEAKREGIAQERLSKVGYAFTDRFDELAACARDAELILQEIDCSQPGDELGVLKVEIPEGSYPRQWLVKAVPKLLERMRAALKDAPVKPRKHADA